MVWKNEVIYKYIQKLNFSNKFFQKKKILLWILRTMMIICNIFPFASNKNIWLEYGSILQTSAYKSGMLTQTLIWILLLNYKLP
jgi:hypothetical protein